jgi:hypothetical protein
MASAANSRESEKFYSSLWARRQQDNTAQSLEISILHILGTIKSQLEKIDEAAEIFRVICSVYLRNMSADDRLPITKMASCLIAAATWCANQYIRLENFEMTRVLYDWVIHGFLARGCKEPERVPSRISATNAAVSPDGLVEFEWAKGDKVAGSQDRAFLLALLD